MAATKISVSLSPVELELLDNYVERAQLSSRSAGVQHAIRLLDSRDLSEAYSVAWAEWAGSEDAHLWEQTDLDGLEPMHGKG